MLQGQNSHHNKKSRRNHRFMGILLLLGFCLFTAFAGVLPVHGKEDKIAERKESIVAIQYGPLVDQEKFLEMKHANGVVIHNGENQAYVLTNYTCCTTSKKKKKKFLKKHKISEDKSQVEWVIRISVKGDVTTKSVEKLAEDKERNYAVLRVAQGLSVKKPAPLGISDDVVTGNDVYALAFPEKDKDRHTDYLAEDVEVLHGKVVDSQATVKGMEFIKFEGDTSGYYTGGPLINDKGYVIGINNRKLYDKGKKTSYAVPVDEIRVALEGYDVDFQSIDKAQRMESFKAALKESKELYESRDYKDKSKKELGEAIEKADSALSSGQQEPDEEELKELSDQLKAGRKALVPKMKTSRKLIIVLGVLIGCLFLWTIRSFIGFLKLRRKVGPDKRKKGSGDGDDKTRGIRKAGPLSESENRDYAPDFRSRKQRAVLCRLKNNQRKMVDKQCFTIGRRKDNDFVIPNDKVGKEHACILWERNRYYVRDLDSLNGTRVNGVMLESEGIQEIRHGDRIVFADEEFDFEIIDR